MLSNKIGEYKPIDDVTIFSSDDLLVNEKLRYKPVCEIDFDNMPRVKKANVAKLLDKVGGEANQHDLDGVGGGGGGAEEKKDESLLDRAVDKELLNGSDNNKRPSSKIALKLKERVRQVSRLSLLKKTRGVGHRDSSTSADKSSATPTAGNNRASLAMMALDGAFNTTGVATSAAGRITGTLLGISQSAAGRAAALASPSAKNSAARMSIFAQMAVERVAKRDEKLTPEERERVVAARKIQKFWRGLYWCEPWVDKVSERASDVYRGAGQLDSVAVG